MKTKILLILWLLVIILPIGGAFLINRPKTSFFEKLTPEQQDKTVMALYEAIFNASQTNWTMKITPRTNELESNIR